MQYTTGITISIFLVCLLIFKKKNRADWVLMCWLIILALHTWLYYLDYSNTIGSFSFLIGLNIPFPLLHGPFLFIYASKLIHSKTKVSKLLLHFLPFIIINIMLIPFYKLSPTEKLYIFQNNGIGYETFVIINTILIFLSGVIYPSMCSFLIQKHRKNIKQNLSQIEGKTLNWLQFLTLGLGLIWILVFIGNNDLIFSGVVLFIILIGIFGVLQNNIFSNETYVTNTRAKSTKDIKYEKSGLNDVDKKSLIIKLEEIIEHEKSHLNPELSLKQLADKIDTHPNYLSQILNEHFQMTFYDYINSKRVEEFCLKMKNNELKNYKLIEIAYECGFNSKSAFNRNFKRFKGKTPTEYKNELQNVSSEKMIPKLNNY